MEVATALDGEDTTSTLTAAWARLRMAAVRPLAVTVRLRTRTQWARRRTRTLEARRQDGEEPVQLEAKLPDGLVLVARRLDGQEVEVVARHQVGLALVVAVRRLHQVTVMGDEHPAGLVRAMAVRRPIRTRRRLRVHTTTLEPQG